MRKPGKKVDTIIVRIDGHYGAQVELDLRLDTRSTTFYAEYQGEMFEAGNVADLKEKIRTRLASTHDVTWQRFIIVNYEAVRTDRYCDGSSHWSSGETDLEANKRRPDEPAVEDDDTAEDEEDDDTAEDEEHVIAGVKLSWHLVEYSSPFKNGSGGRMVRLSRHVDEETGIAAERVEQERDDEIPVNAITYTPERLATLREIRDRIGELDRWLLRVFRGTASEVSKQIDTVAGEVMLLLPSPEPVEVPPSEPKKRSRS